MRSLERKSSRPKSFETEMRPEIFETEASKNGSRDASRGATTVENKRTHTCTHTHIVLKRDGLSAH